MADVKAFRALRYSEKAGAAQTLITQPYDVINAAQQQAYYEANPYNIIRLEWGKEYPTDDAKENRYSRAAADFAAWQKEGVLCQDEAPALYRYVQEYTQGGQTLKRSGFLATIKAEGYDSGMVLPHEETLPAHKADRYELMRACFANFSPIFGLYADVNRVCDRALAEQAANQAPIIDATDEAGVRHQVWQISDPATIQRVREELDTHKVYIADGHHRYETASRFAADMAAQGRPGCDYILIDLVNLYDPGLLVLPTHRLVKNLDGFSSHGLLDALTDSGFATLQEVSLERMLDRMQKAVEKLDVAVFGIYMEGQYHLAALDRDDPIIAAAQPGRSEAYQRLDVSIAHSLILEGLCGVGAKEMAAGSHLAYCREITEAMAKVDAGEYQFALIMNSTRVEELLDVANAGEKMPQKSTYFYPKIIAGLVIHKLGEA